ncbi:hypothetical protein F5Y15DRAFT_413893 [Xylariaceae sp. FL0016]|nr:hypothetical protein F5Y15DRAFT_413893 [Xylariaceae sp. FL0016]
MPLCSVACPLAVAQKSQCLPLLYVLPAPLSAVAHGTPYQPIRTPRQPKQSFHSTNPLRDEAIDNSQNHYETLKLRPGATPAEVKKSFYALSKKHHPDLHRDNPHAPKRFRRISEAYSVLSVPAKRAAYDRDHLNLSSSSSASHAHQHHRGSYSSTNPAGGRPASGLSKRRGTYQGPPPSFYRSGGWGAHSGKRQAAHEDSTGFGSASSTSSSSTSSSSSSSHGGSAFAGGGMGPGQDPFGHRDDVPHFDKEGHERTGRHIDRRRVHRAQADGQNVNIEPERGAAGMFFVVSGVLMMSFMVPFVASHFWKTPGETKKRKT